MYVLYVDANSVTNLYAPRQGCRLAASGCMGAQTNASLAERASIANRARR